MLRGFVRRILSKCIETAGFGDVWLTRISGTPTWYTKDASCDYPVNEYLWLNDLHPTFPVHNATAASIVELLS